MAQCERLPHCPFFDGRMKAMPANATLIKSTLCEKTDRPNCARYLVFKARGVDAVPPDLFPNQLDRAAELLR